MTGGDDSHTRWEAAGHGGSRARSHMERCSPTCINLATSVRHKRDTASAVLCGYQVDRTVPKYAASAAMEVAQCERQALLRWVCMLPTHVPRALNNSVESVGEVHGHG